MIWSIDSYWDLTQIPQPLVNFSINLIFFFFFFALQQLNDLFNGRQVRVFLKRNKFTHQSGYLT